eukprot:6167039-Pleurochrysis_carterae.AAC.1
MRGGAGQTSLPTLGARESDTRAEEVGGRRNVRAGVRLEQGARKSLQMGRINFKTDKREGEILCRGNFEQRHGTRLHSSLHPLVRLQMATTGIAQKRLSKRGQNRRIPGKCQIIPEETGHAAPRPSDTHALGFSSQPASGCMPLGRGAGASDALPARRGCAC